MSQQFKSLGAMPGLAPLPVVFLSTSGPAPGLPESAKATGEQDPPNPAYIHDVTTVAWGGVVNSKPPYLSVALKPERLAWQLLKQNPQCWISLADRSLLQSLDYCGVRSGRDCDKFADCGLNKGFVDDCPTPYLADSPLVIRAEAEKSLLLGSHEVFLLRVVEVLAATRLLDAKGALHMERAELLAYVHGTYVGLDRVLGFFGFSLASAAVYQRRMAQYRGHSGEGIGESGMALPDRGGNTVPAGRSCRYTSPTKGPKSRRQGKNEGYQRGGAGSRQSGKLNKRGRDR
ncbi:flavin reductase family protein [Oscillospiraceae bacterium HV4-5-C5C]|nr:flavin reductase family protein [Oscillospiraceae bacterium HV4-5-C5C]